MGLLRFSRKTILRQALKYAHGNIDTFAEKMAEKFDIPVLDEEEEKEAFELLLSSGLVGLQHVLGGQRLLDEIHISKRQLASTAIDLLQDNLAEFAAEFLPGKPRARSFVVTLLERALVGFEEWVEETPLLE